MHERKTEYKPYEHEDSTRTTATPQGIMLLINRREAPLVEKALLVPRRWALPRCRREEPSQARAIHGAELRGIHAAHGGAKEPAPLSFLLAPPTHRARATPPDPSVVDPAGVRWSSRHGRVIKRSHAVTLLSLARSAVPSLPRNGPPPTQSLRSPLTTPQRARKEPRAPLGGVEGRSVSPVFLVL